MLSDNIFWKYSRNITTNLFLSRYTMKIGVIFMLFLLLGVATDAIGLENQTINGRREGRTFIAFFLSQLKQLSRRLSSGRGPETTVIVVRPPTSQPASTPIPAPNPADECQTETDCDETVPEFCNVRALINRCEPKKNEGEDCFGNIECVSGDCEQRQFLLRGECD